MEIFSKEFLYDWNGGNVSLFKFINSFHGETYDAAMILLSRIADHHNFPYYLAGLAVFAVLQFIVRKLGGQGGASHVFIAWLGVFLVLGAGYATEGILIHYAKDYFSYPRPYVELGGDVRQLEIRPDEDGHHSFPSGHTAFITLMVVGLWPVLAKNLKWAGAALIVGVMWSRIALGMHFPADTLTSVLVMIPMVIFIRMFIYWLLLRLFGMRC